MSLSSPRALRLHWDAETGWVLDVPVALTATQVARVAAWALPRQIARYRGLPPGDRKDQLGHAIELLRQGRVAQRLIDHDRDGIVIPFASTERVTTRRIFHG
jgi:hypothetical protein